jgi:hypothetical protein
VLHRPIETAPFIRTYSVHAGDYFRLCRDTNSISDRAKEFAELVGSCYGGWERQPHDDIHLRGDCLLPNLALHSRYYGSDLTNGRRPRRNWIARSRP